MPGVLTLLRRLPWFRAPAKRALVLAGGGVIGGMYEVGVLAGLDDALPGFRVNDFDLYVGSSSGSVVSSLMANGVRPRDLYEILDEERDDPLNFQRGAVYQLPGSTGAQGVAARRPVDGLRGEPRRPRYGRASVSAWLTGKGAAFTARFR